MNTDGPPLLSALEASSEVLERGLTVPGGPPLYRYLVEQLAAVSGFTLVLIGELAGEKLDQVRVLDAATPEGPTDVPLYALEATPCEVIVGQAQYSIPEGAKARFPRDPHLVDLGIEAYTGMRLDDSDGRPLGLICALHRERVAPEELDGVTRIITAFAPRLAKDLSHRRVVRDLREVLEMDVSEGEEPLSAMTAALVRALEVDGAFVIDRTTRVPTVVALWFEGVRRPAPPLSDGTLSPIVIEDGNRSQHSLLAAVPEASVLHAVDVKDGAVTTGSVGLLSRERLSPRATSSVVFTAFARRVGRELSRRRTEEDRRSVERALSLAQRRESLGALAGGLAHDFNNLLVSILGNAEILRREGLEHQPLELVDDIRLAALRAGELAQKLLAFSGQAPAEPTHVDLGGLITETCRMVRGQLPAGVGMVVRAVSGALPVYGDRAQLQQVLMNLVMNASQSGSPSVDIETRRVRDLELEAREVVVGPPSIALAAEVSVRDAGRGMEDAVLRRIFEPFFTTRAEGHGLGLAAVLGIVREHQGTLVVKSRAGEGSIFQIYLPIDDRTGETPSAAKAETTSEFMPPKAPTPGWSPL